MNTQDLNSLHYELEQEQIRLANGGVAPVIEKWIPVARKKASDEDVDALVEEAEDELEGGNKTSVKGKKTKARGTKRERRKRANSKLGLARVLYASHKDDERKEVVALFMKKLDVSKAVANTYYQIAKKE